MSKGDKATPASWLVQEAAIARQSRRAAEAKAATKRVVARLNGKPAEKPAAAAPNAWSAIVGKRNASTSGSSGAKGAWSRAVAAFNKSRGGD